MKNILYFLIFSSIALSCKPTNEQNISHTNGHQASNANRTSRTGRIIFVTGSCSSGKSSMAKIIAQKLNAKSYAFDEYVMPIVLKKFIKKHYGSVLAYFINWFVMRNFFSSISFLSNKKKYELQKKFCIDLKNGIADEPTSKMYRVVQELAMQGHDVVVESPIYLWDGVNFVKNLSIFNNTKITYVLAYCPWSNLVNRIKKRNLSKNKKVHREFDWALINFMYTFDASTRNHGNNFLEQLNGSEVSQTITKYTQPQYKKKHLQLMTETQNMASKLFHKNANYLIYPRFNYNLTVNTRTNNPEQAADIVLDYIQTKTTNSMT